MRLNFFGLDALHDTKSSAAIFLVIGIQDLFVGSFVWQAEAMSFAHYGREVADADNFLSI